MAVRQARVKNNGAAAAETSCPDAGKAGNFYFERRRGDWLLTNDWGRYVTLPPEKFHQFLAGKISASDPLGKELESNGFVRDRLDFSRLAKNYRTRNAFLWQGPSLHILVVTLRCNHKCLYCHSSAVAPADASRDMSFETAKAAVDMIFQSPSPSLVIEFQGGEPLLNWPVVRFVIRYAKAKNKVVGKNLQLALVTNMSLMDEKKLKFLLDSEVSLCTSLDGPRELHEKNRIYLGGSSYDRAAFWIREISRRYGSEQAPKRKVYKPSALMTTTRLSLPLWRSIVDEYVQLGMEGIFLRPLSPIGYAKRVWPKIGYSGEEFVAFYRQALDYILKINLDGREFMERMTTIALAKILKQKDPGFVDLRSPCGAGIGQMAYNYDGSVYTCDEGRMVAHQGNELFRIGDVAGGYDQAVSSQSCRSMCVVSNLETQPSCRQCVYKPYCGICPVHNYEAQGSLCGNMPSSDYCAVHKGIFSVIFERLEDPRSRSVFESWTRERVEEPA